MEEFKTSTNEGKISNFYDLFDLEPMAAKVIPKGAFDYIASGAGDEFTLGENVRSFEHKLVEPRVLRDLDNPDMTVTVDGDQLTAPIIGAPVASHKLANEMGEVDSAKGIAAFGTIYSISSYASTDLPEVTAALNGSPEWFQFYMSKDDQVNRDIMDRVKAQGIKKIILTADATVGGNREADARNGFVYPVPMPIVDGYMAKGAKSVGGAYSYSKQSLSLADIKFIKDYSDLPVYVKGVQSAEDVDRLIEAGADGIWVSNHGGRQLDAGAGSFDCLQDIAKAVDHRVPVIFDSGVRRGQHIFKAIASGADLVAIGRPMLYGLALGGAEGVTQVFEQLAKELKMVMQLTGCKTVEDIKHYKLRDNPYDPSFGYRQAVATKID